MVVTVEQESQAFVASGKTTQFQVVSPAPIILMQTQGVEVLSV